jgi:hypothetical protein
MPFISPAHQQLRPHPAYVYGSRMQRPGFTLKRMAASFAERPRFGQREQTLLNPGSHYRSALAVNRG